MKIKRMLVVIVVLVGLLCAQDAFAFYNSSTGRWLSRDPIEEQGGNALYSFVANRPVSNADRHGLVIVGFYGADTNYGRPNEGNQWLEWLSSGLETTEKVLRPPNPLRPYSLYHSRADGPAFIDLLRYLDTNKDGQYDSCDKDEPIKIFGWSWGGASAVELANRIHNSDKFKKKDIKVIAVLDPVTAFRPANHTVPENVQRFWNRYQRNGANVLLLGLPNHGHSLAIANSSKTVADQVQLDPNGRIEGLDHITIVIAVTYDFVDQFFR